MLLSWFLWYHVKPYSAQDNTVKIPNRRTAVCLTKGWNSLYFLDSSNDVFPSLSALGPLFMPLEKRPPKGAVSGTVNGFPGARVSVRYDARFHRFSYSSSNFSMTAVERVIRKRLSDSFIHNSAIIK